jgi:hypothetical protein
MLRKISGQMAVFYGPQCPAYTLTKSLPLSLDYERDFAVLKWPAYRKILTSYRPAVDFMDRTRLLAQVAPIIQQSVYVLRPLDVLAQTYRPTLVVALVSSVLVLCRRTYRRSLGWLAALILFAYSYNFAACLEVAIVQSLEVVRFTTVQVFPTILAQFLAIWLILEFALKVVRGVATGAERDLERLKAPT